MKSLYWYAIIATPSDGEGIPERWGVGLREQPLDLVCEDGLSAVVSAWTGAAVGRTADAVDAALVLQHEQIIEAIMADVPVLPMRFGTVLASAERIAAILGERYMTFTGDLARVGGCVEMGVRILWPGLPATEAEAVPAVAATPGAQYLQQRLAADRQQRAARSHGQAVAGALDAALHGAAVDARVTVLPTERMLLSGAYLVRRSEVAAFTTQVESLRRQQPELAFLCTGPWPPYNFVSGGDR